MPTALHHRRSTVLPTICAKRKKVYTYSTNFSLSSTRTHPTTIRVACLSVNSRHQRGTFGSHNNISSIRVSSVFGLSLYLLGLPSPNQRYKDFSVHQDVLFMITNRYSQSEYRFLIEVFEEHQK
jgi:hypothetical protein